MVNILYVAQFSIHESEFAVAQRFLIHTDNKVSEDLLWCCGVLVSCESEPSVSFLTSDLRQKSRLSRGQWGQRKRFEALCAFISPHLQ